MTGLWAFETQLPYQKNQGPPIVVRWGLKVLENLKGPQSANGSKSPLGPQIQ